MLTGNYSVPFCVRVSTRNGTNVPGRNHIWHKSHSGFHLFSIIVCHNICIILWYMYFGVLKCSECEIPPLKSTFYILKASLLLLYFFSSTVSSICLSHYILLILLWYFIFFLLTFFRFSLFVILQTQGCKTKWKL